MQCSRPPLHLPQKQYRTGLVRGGALPLRTAQHKQDGLRAAWAHGHPVPDCLPCALRPAQPALPAAACAGSWQRYPDRSRFHHVACLRQLFHDGVHVGHTANSKLFGQAIEIQAGAAGQRSPRPVLPVPSGHPAWANPHRSGTRRRYRTALFWAADPAG